MAKTLRHLRRQIRMVGKIHQITKAMQMVAAAKLRRVQQRTTEGRVYWQRMQEIVRELSGAALEVVKHPLLTPRPVERIGLVVIAADKGLCGGYNLQIARQAQRFVEIQDHPVVLKIIGQKTRPQFERARYEIEAQFSVDDKTLAQDALRVASDIRQWYEQGSVDEVHICYAQFVSMARDKPTVVRLLPVATLERTEEQPVVEYIFEPPAAELLGRLMPRYVNAQVYQMLLEASASEHAARMRAMANATENAEEMIEKLRMQANRLRQQEITAELLDVIGGAEALAV